MKAKKSLGQNFLKSEPALREIIKAGEIEKGRLVLEIGPGKGTLTKKLLEAGARVLAVEKDRELFEFLKIKFEKEIKNGQLLLKNDDILELDTEKAFVAFSNGDEAKQDIPRKRAQMSKYKIIANIPYNITGAILKKFLTAENQPERMVLMVQLEVAKRIMARDDKESILSISIKAYGEPKMVMKVPARYFSPAPKVDSAVISIKNISRDIFEKNKITEENFWEIVKAGFAHKRKKLFGNLKGVIPLEKTDLDALRDKRAEDLSLSDWILLAK